MAGDLLLLEYSAVAAAEDDVVTDGVAAPNDGEGDPAAAGVAIKRGSTAKGDKNNRKKS